MWKIWINGVVVFKSLYYGEAATWYKFLIDEGIDRHNISLNFEL